MARFVDQDELRREAQERLAKRKGESSSTEKDRARQRLEARTGSAKSTDVSFFSSFITFMRGLPLPYLIAAVAVAIALVVVVFFGVGQLLSSRGGSSQEAAAENSDNTSFDDQGEGQQAEPEVLTLPSYIDADLAERMILLAKTDPSMEKIVKNADRYANEDEAVRTKLFELAVAEKEALPFVYGVVDSYPAAECGAYTEKLNQGTVPHLYQWDTRWGYKDYSSAPFGLTGCCPTAFSMVYMGLTGKADMTPAAMADLAQSMNYVSEYNGTVADFVIAAAPELGLVGFESYIDSSYLSSGLDDGYVYICNVGPGDFTNDGHFIVICGKANDGRLIVNDPYSKVRSEQTWDIDDVINQCKGLYAFKLA